MVWAAVVGSVLGGVISSQASKKAGRKAVEIGKANAADLRRISKTNAAEITRIAGLNSRAVLDTATLNSNSIIDVASANSSAFLSTATDNIDLASTEFQETLRRHILKEQSYQGRIRASYGASGIQVGAGSALEIMDEAITSGRDERNFLANYATKRLAMMGSEGIRRANLTMLDAKSRSKVLLETAALQSSIMTEEAESRAKTMLSDSEANARSLERGGQLIAATQRAQGTASLISGIMGGVNMYMQYGR